MNLLDELAGKSEYILREAKAQFKNPCVLWSGGKDSTLTLYLIKQAMGEVPFPVVHMDTDYKFPVTKSFMARLTKEWGLNFVRISGYYKNQPSDKLKCCQERKTDALKRALAEGGYDAVITSIRRDEHYMRNLERTFSPRDKDFKWKLVREKTEAEKLTGDSDFESLQDTEMGGWDLYATDFTDAHHVRVHPILGWTELDVWEYTKRENIPVNELYFSKDGKRYRSIGCVPCTTPVDSEVKNLDEMIEELKTTQVLERDGRDQDKEDGMRQMRVLGYM